MDNITLWLIFMIVDLSVVIIAFKLFGKIGLYGIIVMSIIIANIQVMKLIDIFGITITLGNILYGSIFFATDLLSEFFGKKEAKKAVWLGFFVLLVSTLYLQLTIIFLPSGNDFIHPHMKEIFSLLPRIALGSLIAYLISQHHDVWLFNLLKEKTNGRHLWLRNNASTLTSQLIDSTVFCLIAFLGVFPLAVFLQILITTYIFKVIVAAFDTPFMYLAKCIIS